MFEISKASIRTVTKETSNELQATDAIFIHETNLSGEAKQILVRHPISHGKIMQGKIISNAAAIKRLIGFNTSHASQKQRLNSTLESSFLDERIIAQNSEYVAFYCKRAPRTIWTSVEENLSFTISCPSLVFIYSKSSKSLDVYAYLQGGRPKLETMLYLVPFMNISNSGNVCTGSMKLPRTWGQGSVDTIVNSFFNSRFTHSNYRDLGSDIYDMSYSNLEYLERLASSQKRMKKADLIPYKILSETLGRFK